jgi:8-hydroxy-5-deazaflavin:NADPH oxidoreductase
MTVGIIGAGLIGAAFARRLAQANLPAILSNSRGPDSLADLVADIGRPVRAGTGDEAAAQDLVLVAVNWSKVPFALKGFPGFRGRIVIDANNPIEPPTFQPVDLHGRLSTVVKAFNHFPAAVMGEDPHVARGTRVLFFAGLGRACQGGGGRPDRQAWISRDRPRPADRRRPRDRPPGRRFDGPEPGPVRLSAVPGSGIWRHVFEGLRHPLAREPGDAR